MVPSYLTTALVTVASNWPSALQVQTEKFDSFILFVCVFWLNLMHASHRREEFHKLADFEILAKMIPSPHDTRLASCVMPKCNTISALVFYYNHLLVIKHNVWDPYGVGGHSDGGNAQVLIRVPAKLHVNPFLTEHQIVMIPCLPWFGPLAIKPWLQ